MFPINNIKNNYSKGDQTLWRDFILNVRSSPFEFWDRMDRHITDDHKKFYHNGGPMSMINATRGMSDRELYKYIINVAVPDCLIYRNGEKAYTLTDIKNSFEDDSEDKKINEILNKNQAVIIDKLEKYIIALFDKVNILADAVDATRKNEERDLFIEVSPP
jgi:hypothetical protein